MCKCAHYRTDHGVSGMCLEDNCSCQAYRRAKLSRKLAPRAVVVLPSDEMPVIIVSVVLAAFDLTNQRLTGRRRTREVAWARQVACYLLHRLTKLSTTCIGRTLNREHTTILHSVALVESRMKHLEIAQFIDRLETLCREPAVKAGVVTTSCGI